MSTEKIRATIKFGFCESQSTEASSKEPVWAINEFRLDKAERGEANHRVKIEVKRRLAGRRISVKENFTNEEENLSSFPSEFADEWAHNNERRQFSPVLVKDFSVVRATFRWEIAGELGQTAWPNEPGTGRSASIQLLVVSPRTGLQPPSNSLRP